MLMYDFLSLSSLAILLSCRRRTFGSLASIRGSSFPGSWFGVSIALVLSRHHDDGASKALCPCQRTDVLALGYARRLWSSSGGYDVSGPWIEWDPGAQSGRLCVFNWSLLFVEIPATPKRWKESCHAAVFERSNLWDQVHFPTSGLLGLQLVFSRGICFRDCFINGSTLSDDPAAYRGNTGVLGAVQSGGALAAVVAGIFLTTGEGSSVRPAPSFWLDRFNLLGLPYWYRPDSVDLAGCHRC